MYCMYCGSIADRPVCHGCRHEPSVRRSNIVESTSVGEVIWAAIKALLVALAAIAVIVGLLVAMLEYLS